MTKQYSIFDTLKDKTGYTCECCGSYVKTYVRNMNCNMAILLVRLYKHNEMGFTHIEKFLSKHGYPRCGDFSYLTHYGLLEKKIGDREDGSNRNGFYKITGRGLAFVSGALTVHSKFKMFNGKFMGFEGEQIDIKTALGRKFDYAQLMSN